MNTQANLNAVNAAIRAAGRQKHQAAQRVTRNASLVQLQQEWLNSKKCLLGKTVEVRRQLISVRLAIAALARRLYVASLHDAVSKMLTAVDNMATRLALR